MSYTPGFVKVHGQLLLDSSIWGRPYHIRLMWLTMLAMANREGVVQAAMTGVVRRALVTQKEGEEAIREFLAPDPDSRSSGSEGRRIEVVEGGWRLINYEHYRELGSREQAAEMNRARVQRHRDKKRGNGPVMAGNGSNPIAEAEAEAEAKAKRTPVVPPSARPAAGTAPTKKPKYRKFPIPETWQPNAVHIELANKFGTDVSRQAEQFRDHAMANRRLLVDWDAGFRNWLRKFAEFKFDAKIIRQVRPDAPRGSWMDANEHRFKNQRHGPPGGSDDPEAQKSPKSPKNPGSGPAKGTPEAADTDEIPY